VVLAGSRGLSRKRTSFIGWNSAFAAPTTPAIIPEHGTTREFLPEVLVLGVELTAERTPELSATALEVL
jgi:hypothetical protein